MKPILWIDKKVFEGKWTTMALVSTVEPPSEDAVALYAPTKPLSDEEIDEVSKAVWERPWLEKHREFARAIEKEHEIL